MSSLVGQYKDLIWWTMDVVGVSRSIRWKVLMAVGIQFAVSVALTVVPLLFAGWPRIWATVGLFGLAIVAFANTVLVVRDDIIDPIVDLETASRHIARGDLDVAVAATDQQDEIGRLGRSFAEMRHNLDVVAGQAEALADQRFDAPVLDRDIPGRFGRSLQSMTDNLQGYVDRIETDRDRFQLLNYLVGHDVPNLVNVIYARVDLLRENCADEDVHREVDVIEDQAEEIEYLSNTVADLTSRESVRRVDVKYLLVQEVERIRTSFPAATVTLDLPDEPVYLQCNDLVARVFENLVVNGIEHNDATEPRVDVEMRETDEEVVVTVADNGPGFDVPAPDVLFEHGDQGSGLSLIATIVSSFEGDIDVVESSAAGTTIRIRFPHRDEDESVPDETTTDWLTEMSAATPE